MNRKELLTMLVNGEGNPREIQDRLSKFGWDSANELVVLTRAHSAAVLQRVVSGQLDADAMEDWANAIEGRDDIGLEAGYETILKSFIHEAANPSLVRAFTAKKAEAWLSRLKNL